MECEWCKEYPPKPCPALHFEKETGSFFFDPMPSEKHENHYTTYLVMIELQKTDFKSIQGQQGRCEICPNWWFSSPTEMKCHRRLLHQNTSFTNMVDIYDGRATHQSSKEFRYCRFKVNGKV